MKLSSVHLACPRSKMMYDRECRAKAFQRSLQFQGKEKKIHWEIVTFRMHNLQNCHRELFPESFLSFWLFYMMLCFRTFLYFILCSSHSLCYWNAVHPCSKMKVPSRQHATCFFTSCRETGLNQTLDEPVITF